MRARDDLAPFLVHGGRVAAARALFGGGDWIDLSTGIAPWAWPLAGDPAYDRLPEPAEIAALEAAAAAAFGVADPARVVAVPGTDLAMRLLAGVLGAGRPAVLHPGYGGHRAAWPDAVAVTRIEDDPDHDLIVFASPSNPTGATVPPDRVRALSERQVVVVDEAYADPRPGMAPDASDRLVVLRSFGKFYGLPGLRLGFVLAGPAVTARLRALLGDWPVSAAAVEYGTAAYRDAGWLAAQVERIAAAGTALDALLGNAIVGRAPLFRLIEVADAARLFRCCAAHAILTRPFADDPRRLRIGLPADAAALDRLSRALEDYAHDRHA